jgi:trimeric autotransporter adhesin
VRLFLKKPVLRFACLALLLFCAVPFGLSVGGCASKVPPPEFCNPGDSGPVVGQVAAITLAQNLAITGESLSYGQIGQSLSATAQDCRGNSVGLAKFTFAINDMTIADINPSTGQVCAGTWNRNTGGGVPDFTTCTPPATPNPNHTAFVTATANGAVSNAIAVYVHAIVTGIVLGPPSANAPNCSTLPDPGTDCCPANTATVYTPTPSAYFQNSCISQGKTAQLVARVYQNGTTLPQDNITCQVGHLTFATPTASTIASIDENGVATAEQPGSTLITASVSGSSTAAGAGFFSTCPAKSIVLSVAGQPGVTSVNVALNNTQPLVAVVTDTNNNPLSGVALEFESTSPQTIPGGSDITPVFPGSAAITAVCQPGQCNPSPFSQIGFLGNGMPLTSNSITINSTGSSSTVIYMGSTQSQYLMPMDFTTGLQGSLIKLPYPPNSMVISQD